MSFSPPSGGELVDGVRQNAVAKKRRRNQNVEIDELGELLPYRRADGKALDKLSILRLTTSLFKFQNFMSRAYGVNAHKENVLSDLLDEAMDGFLMVIASDGGILYASDNMESFVALNPRDVIGHSLHDLVQSQQDSDTITKNLQPKGDKSSQYRTFFLELKNTAPPKSPLFGNKMLLRLSGHLKVAVKRCPTTSVDSSPGGSNDSSPKPFSKLSSSGESGPHVLGLVAECRPMTPSTMAINMEIYFPDLSFSSTLSLDGLLLSTDDRLGKLLGFGPDAFAGNSYKTFTHPGDTEMLDKAHEFLARTGFVEKPPYRVLSASGDWVWLKNKCVLRYNKKTNKPMYYDMQLRIVGHSEGSIRYVEERRLSGWIYGIDNVLEHQRLALPEGSSVSNSLTYSPSPTPSPSSSVATNGSFLSPIPSPSSSTGLPTQPQSQYPVQPNPFSYNFVEMMPPNLSAPQQQQQQHFQQQQQQREASDQALEILPPNLFTQQQQFQQQQQHPPPPSQEWMERQRQLEDKIQTQKQLLQDLLVQQELLQKMVPRQPEIATAQQNGHENPNHSPLSSGYSGSLSSLAPSPLSTTNSDHAPSPLEATSVQSRSISSLAPAPLSYGGVPKPSAPQPLLLPQMGGQNTTTEGATNVSFLGSVDLLSSGSPDSALPLSPDIQELLQQFM